MSGKPPHHTPEGFRNPLGGAYAKYTISGADRWAFLWRRMVFPGPAPTIPEGHMLPEAEALAGFEAMQGRPAVTWLGHAAFLLRLGGKTIITDPWLTQNASPLGGIGVSRLVPPGMAIEKLPPIDALIISHNHYDHLDAATVEALPNKERITVLAPLGLGDFFRGRGYRDVRELDWHDRAQLGAVTVTSLPAVHFSRRGLSDSNRTLWMGAMIEGDGQRIYFSGDTAHGPVFARLGERYGPFDLALVPIGAYEPLAMMRAVHTTPEDAVALGLDLDARILLGHHWGTVILTDEPLFEPPGRFRAAGRAAGIEDDRLWLMRIGETRALNKD
ncbi:MAG: MBL fold metallo-hydrolase [Alphaproteobacteria bacterium]|nr:MBL fold metallo-hydrolase [Alphaproteobacteria bacterium]